MILKDVNAGIFNLKINIGQFFGSKEEDFYVVLREPTTDEALRMKSLDENALMKDLPKMMIEHNFQNEDGSDMTNQQVWNLILPRSGCSTLIVKKWGEEIPLAQVKSKKQVESQDTQSVVTD